MFGILTYHVILLFEVFVLSDDERNQLSFLHHELFQRDNILVRLSSLALRLTQLQTFSEQFRITLSV